jgi:hypothetical protein
MSVTLAILVPTLRSRRELLRRMMDRFQPQMSDRIGIWTLEDGGTETTGRKRQRLLETVDAPYVCFFDDDDVPAPTYCRDILDAIDGGVDVVGFKVRYFKDGFLEGRSIHSLASKSWSEGVGPDGLVSYLRTPNHLNPIRREIALAVGYKSITLGEDADYSRRLFDRFGKSMKEFFIDKFLYDYLYRTRREPAPNNYDESGTLTRDGAERIIRSGGSVSFGGRICSKVEHLDSL